MALWLTLLSSLLCLFSTFVVEQSDSTTEADPYSMQLVQMALRTRTEGQIIAKVQTHLSRMGDGVSIALLKILTEDDFREPHRVQEFLPIIREAFSQPQLISNEIDKKPKVTLFLLAHIRQDVPDIQAQHDIDETIQFLRQKTEGAQ
jgi:hypothetical protein